MMEITCRGEQIQTLIMLYPYEYVSVQTQTITCRFSETIQYKTFEQFRSCLEDTISNKAQVQLLY